MLRSFILSLCALFLLPAPLSPPSVPLSPSPTPTPTPSQQSQIKYPANSDLYILMYHNFVAETDGQLTPWTLTQSRFRQDLQWLVDQGYSFVLPGDLAAGKPLPPKAVMLTFDDGYVSNYTIAYPLLQELNVQTFSPGRCVWKCKTPDLSNSARIPMTPTERPYAVKTVKISRRMHSASFRTWRPAPPSCRRTWVSSPSTLPIPTVFPTPGRMIFLPSCSP